MKHLILKALGQYIRPNCYAIISWLIGKVKVHGGTGKEICGARRTKAMPRHACAPASVYVYLRNFQLLRGRKRRSCIRSKYSRRSAHHTITVQGIWNDDQLLSPVTPLAFSVVPNPLKCLGTF